MEPIIIAIIAATAGIVAALISYFSARSVKRLEEKFQKQFEGLKKDLEFIERMRNDTKTALMEFHVSKKDFEHCVRRISEGNINSEYVKGIEVNYKNLRDSARKHSLLFGTNFGAKLERATESLTDNGKKAISKNFDRTSYETSQKELDAVIEGIYESFMPPESLADLRKELKDGKHE